MFLFTCTLEILDNAKTIIKKLIIISNITRNRAEIEIGAISPYPIVEKVVILKYRK